MKDELYLLSLSSDQFSGDYLTAKDALDSAISGRTYANTAEALDAVYTSLKNAGVPLDELDENSEKIFQMQLSQWKQVQRILSVE